MFKVYLLFVLITLFNDTSNELDYLGFYNVSSTKRTEKKIDKTYRTGFVILLNKKHIFDITKFILSCFFFSILDIYFINEN